MAVVGAYSETVLGVIPIVGDGRDIVTEIWNFATSDDDASSFVLTIAVLGLSADLGTFVAAPLGAPVNVVLAVIKGVFKAIPTPITKAVILLAGGGLRGIHRFSGYVLKFLDNFADGDWLNVAKLRESIENLLRQIDVMTDSPLVRHSGLDDEAVADFVGEGVGILAGRGRRLTDPAAEGCTAYVRHGDEGAAALEELISGFPADVADDCAECVGEAISKTYRDALLDGTDAQNVERIDDAVRAARGTLDPHLRDLVSPHIGPDKTIR